MFSVKTSLVTKLFSLLLFLYNSYQVLLLLHIFVLLMSFRSYNYSNYFVNLVKSALVSPIVLVIVAILTVLLSHDITYLCNSGYS
jgi:hypothetical protein